jgi:ABC-type antimicrobial peptide transport system permease subunit
LASDTGEVIGLGFEPTLGVVWASLGVAASLGILGGYLPAIMASRVSPMEAIRGG